MGNKSVKYQRDLVGIEELRPGDVLLFVEKSGNFMYLVRACKWSGYTFAAFVVRSGGGDAELCGHFPAQGEGERPSHLVKIERLSSQLASGVYEAVYVRCLEHPLGAASTHSVQKFASHICTSQSEENKVTEPRSSSGSGKFHGLDEEVAVLMAGNSPSLACRSSVERFSTSRLVADMLTAAGQATGEGHTYGAVTENDRLLQPIAELDMPERFRLSRRVRGGAEVKALPGQRSADNLNPFSNDVSTVG